MSNRNTVDYKDSHYISHKLITRTYRVMIVLQFLERSLWQLCGNGLEGMRLEARTQKGRDFKRGELGQSQVNGEKSEAT